VLGLDGGLVGLVVGDVVGHDIAASTSMGQLRSALRAYTCEEQPHPAPALARVDRLFDALGLTYATCVLATLDPEHGRLRWSNAGHPPPLLLRDLQATFLRDGDGVMLGVTAGADLSEGEIDLRLGDVLVLYTDGLIERRGEALGDGMERLAAAVMEMSHSHAAADPLSDALLAELVPMSAVRGDDVALLVVRVVGGEDGPPVHRIDLAASPESAAIARGFVAGVLASPMWRRTVDTATLLTSELVTNAVRHGHPPYSLAVTVDADSVEISVEDADATVPEPRNGNGGGPAVDPYAEDGRGLLLLSALAADWGVRPLLTGKAIWFSLPASGA
jgi:anti-sigma regulatory factor (Ser/Thr protein kinase)